MAFNRIIDREFDARNPRTQSRELVTGEVSLGSAVGIVILASIGFLLVAALLGRHCLYLAPFVLAYLFFYSYSKRFTRYSHFVLGGALALAPGGAWWVLRPQLELTPILLMLAVAFWVAGFDVIYSCQDEHFDRTEGLYSLPAAVGAERALLLARFFHLLSFLILIAAGSVLELGMSYFIGLLPIGLLFIYQHSLVSAADLSRVNRAFFTVNGWVSVYYLLLVASPLL
jgi:4-hydroxybenzoate polyprenyltransferase